MLDIFVNTYKDDFTNEDSEKIKRFLDKLEECGLGTKILISVFLTKPEVYVKINDEFYEQKEKQDVWRFYRSKEKIITAGIFNMIDDNVNIDLKSINNELERVKELIWE